MGLFLQFPLNPSPGATGVSVDLGQALSLISRRSASDKSETTSSLLVFIDVIADDASGIFFLVLVFGHDETPVPFLVVEPLG